MLLDLARNMNRVCDPLLTRIDRLMVSLVYV